MTRQDRVTTPQLDELNPINLGRAQTPITFAAANARFLSQFPDGADELWSADITAGCHGALCDTTQGVFESINRNANIGDYTTPFSNPGYACVDPHIQLLGEQQGGTATDIPEPATAAMLGLGLGAVVLARRRRAAFGPRA